jgi:hypothetical protein
LINEFGLLVVVVRLLLLLSLLDSRLMFITGKLLILLCSGKVLDDIDEIETNEFVLLIISCGVRKVYAQLILCFYTKNTDFHRSTNQPSSGVKNLRISK